MALLSILRMRRRFTPQKFDFCARGVPTPGVGKAGVFGNTAFVYKEEGTFPRVVKIRRKKGWSEVIKGVIKMSKFGSSVLTLSVPLFVCFIHHFNTVFFPPHRSQCLPSWPMYTCSRAFSACFVSFVNVIKLVHIDHKTRYSLVITLTCIYITC